MARIEVPMPQMGESIVEGTVSAWLKKVGDRVERDEPIMEISTDKVDAEIPSPASGVLVEIVVKAGDTVEVGTTVAYVETDPGAATATPAVASSDETAPSGFPRDATTDSVETGNEPAIPSSVETPSSGVSGSGASRKADGPETAEDRLRRRSTPLVRRIAEENGVMLSDVTGTGRAGRVTKQDILDFIAKGGSPRPVQPSSTSERAQDGDFGWNRFYTEVEHPEIAVGPNDRVVPMSRMTSLIAEHMVVSKRTSAHVHSYFEVDYSRIDQVRARNQTAWEELGVKITYTIFIAKAVAQALAEHPQINAAISGKNVVYRGDINLGIAVALDWGLVVPVVRNAGNLSIVGLARTIDDLATRARAKKLGPDELQGGTFTITNPGIYGAVLGFPIINQPQVAIMGVGAVEKRPVVITDDFGNDAIVARKRGFISLGFDHRLVNGADADRFLARVKAILESFPE